MRVIYRLLMRLRLPQSAARREPPWTKRSRAIACESARSWSSIIAGEAIEHLLEPVHCGLAQRTANPADSAAVLRCPAPLVAAHAGVMSIEDPILLLIGEENRLIVHHVHRLIAVERVPPTP